MVVCENTGEYKAYLLDSPLGYTIEAAYAFESGFLIAIGTSFLIFKSNIGGDERAPFKQIGHKSNIIMAHKEHISSTDKHDELKIVAMTVNSTEDQIYVITNASQLIKGEMELNIDGP